MEIVYKGYNISINTHLLSSQGVWDNLKLIVLARIEVYKVLELAESYYKHGRLNKENGKKLLDKLTKCEYDLQRVWNFPEDIAYHSYQWRLVGCRCPSMDNRERLGTDSMIINVGCPYHSL